MKTIDIKGTPYVTVNSRLTYFRENYEGYRLTSEILSDNDGVVTMKATIADAEGNILATGHAQEREGSTFINKTSHVENCETSAWGRCLANLGIGVDAAVASYEEVANAVIQQKEPRKKKKKSVCATEQTISKNFIEATLMDCTTIDEVTQVWWKLTAQQQEDKDIKFWFNARKEQLQ